MKKHLFPLLVLSFVVMATSVKAATVIDYRYTDASSLSQTELDNARKQDVLFNHQSVGSNIITGLDTMKKADPGRYSISMKASQDISWYDTYDGINHFKEGANGAPSGKISGKKNLVATYNSKIDVAFMKFCFVDVSADLDALWIEYRDAMEELESTYPNIKFIWWTMPITINGSQDRDSFNANIRNYVNQNNKILFDIASIESHDPSGNAIKDSGYDAMYSGYTDDGGHLNTSGQARAAAAIWHLFAVTAGSGGNTVPTPTPTQTITPTPVPTGSTLSFSDILSCELSEYIVDLYNLGVVSGYADGTFKPDNGVTRAQMSKFIVKAFDLQVNTGGTKFPDVTDMSAELNTYIQTLKNLDIVNGYSDGLYHPNYIVTRGQVTKYIVETMNEIIGQDLTELGLSSYFPDVATNSTFYKYITVLTTLEVDGERIIKGYSDGLYRPDEDLTRAQMSKIVSLSREYLVSAGYLQ
ncbi:MAG: S-layer homology domain-containing protein [Ignavibacteriae bacterium]|nr:S-layer homology domain-containing protein [Ignavibacteriota bacterium]